jgi:hypothetical protein
MRSDSTSGSSTDVAISLGDVGFTAMSGPGEALASVHRVTTPARRRCANFSREPLFLLRGPSYMRDLPPERADSPQERIGGVDGGGG